MKRYDPQKHHRRSIRLRGYDYTQPGAYFVTLCTQGRECYFGEVVETEMVLNDAGQMIRAGWERLTERFPAIQLDMYVVMPNHLHGIITIVGAPLVGAPIVDALGVRATTRVAPAGGAERRATLGNMVGAFKSLTTNQYARGVRERKWPSFDGRLWQRNYFEHIIRSKRDHDAIRQYIIDNPLEWELNRHNPGASRTRSS